MEVTNAHFENDEAFFVDMQKLMTDFQWIYESRNTDLLVDNVLDRVPTHWITVFHSTEHVRLAVNNDIQMLWPEDLTDFVKRCHRLSLRLHNSVPIQDDDCQVGNFKRQTRYQSKIGQKKQHEVIRFSRLIGQHCRQNGIHHVVDVGSGLGYLDKELADEWEVDVLGLERDEYRVAAANKRSASDSHRRCRATFKQLTVEGGAALNDCHIESIVTDWLDSLSKPNSMTESKPILTVDDSVPLPLSILNSVPYSKSIPSSSTIPNDPLIPVPLTAPKTTPKSIPDDPASIATEQSIPDTSSALCMVGLHSCGDLSPAMMELFVNNSRYRSLMLVSCCYHRMESLRHFPMSRRLGRMSLSFFESVETHRGSVVTNWLRLAAQETPNQWLLRHGERRRNQELNTFYRAVVQLYSIQEGIHLVKKQRRPLKNGDVTSNFEDYVDKAIESFGLNVETEDNNHRQKLLNLYRRSEHLLPALATLLALQVVLQPVAESLILVDRMVWLKETGRIDVAELTPIFDDRLSPRSFALVARKKLEH